MSRFLIKQSLADAKARAHAATPYPGTGGTQLSQGKHGTSISIVKATLKQYMRGAIKRFLTAHVTGTYKISGTAVKGWYTGLVSNWKGVSSETGPATDANFRDSTSHIVIVNLDEIQPAADTSVNKLPALDPQSPNFVQGFADITDGNGLGTGALSAMLVRGGYKVGMPGVIVTSGPGGAANFTSASPQMYWVQQAQDASTDTDGKTAPTWTAMTGGSIVAAADGKGNPSRMAAGTSVWVQFVNNAGTGNTLKAFIVWAGVIVGDARFVKLVDDGTGSNGDATNQATYKYNAESLDSSPVTIASSLSPFTTRPNGEVVKATLGLIYTDASGTIILGWNNEYPNTCT